MARQGRRSRVRIAAAAALVVVTGSLVAGSAGASHPVSTLSGSSFEIDNDANLKLDDPAPARDWANVVESRRNDTATGANDNSYAGGAKEDDTCPSTTTGSIPNNKSDLLTFGAYVEPEAGGPGFLNLFWTRVLDPSGTTLMDFELNQSATGCGNGVNPARTAGDLLIEYRIEQGGAKATIKVRTWSGSAWGAATDLTAANKASGTINSTPIPAADSDGLLNSGSVSARTFGEAQLDLDFVFKPGACTSFGSAFIKSRASDSFTSQLKDFILPVPVNISNCAQVIIRKQTDPDGSAGSFGFTKAFNTAGTSSNTFSLSDNGSKSFGDVLLGSGLTVVEDTLPAGWDLAGVDCSASSGVTPSINGATVTFAVDSSSDILDCTYTNRARGALVIVKQTTSGQGAFGFTSGSLTPASFTLTTTGAGSAGQASKTFSSLPIGTYDVAETVPTGWNLTGATCSDGSQPSAIGIGAGETVTCTFVNDREVGAIAITKTRKHAADGPGAHPQPGVTFTVTGGELPAAGVTATTDANGVACVPGLVLSSFVGGYTVTETVPSGYTADGATAKAVSVTTEGDCSGGATAGVAFSNTPLTNVTVAIDSIVNGGTASTINCTGAATGSGSTTTGGDGSLTLTGVAPGTVTCTIVIDP